MLPLLVTACVLVAGCGEEEEKHSEGGVRPRIGGAAPELPLGREPLKVLTGAELRRDALEDTGEAEVDEVEELMLSKVLAGSPAVIHFDSASNPISARQSEELSAAKAAAPAGTVFLSVVLGKDGWQGLGKGGVAVYYARRHEAVDAWGCHGLPMIAAVDSAGKVRRLGAFSRADELGKMLAGLAEAPLDEGK